MSFSKFLLQWSRVCAVALATWAGTLPSQGQPTFDAFDPNADGNIYAMVAQPDGKILVGGGFVTFQPNRFGSRVVRFRIARLNADGSVDPNFTPRIDGGEVTCMALQDDGKIIVGGKFSTVWGTGDFSANGHPRNGLVRFNPDGSLDDSFDPHPKLAADQENQLFPIAVVRAIAVQPNGQILVGGAFTGFAGSGTFQTQERVARLNADGSLDTTFTAAVNNVVQAIALQPDGKILVGGGFSKLRPTGATGFGDAAYLVRLNADGTHDIAFTSRPDNRVLALKVAVDNRILVGGEFTHITVGSTPTARTFLARLLADGTVDTTFNPAPDAAIEALAIQVDGKILFGGRFTSLRPGGGSQSFRSYVVRVTSEGALDIDFVVNPNAPVAAIALQSDTSVLLAGYFTTASSRLGGSSARGRIARIQADGLLETVFTPQTGGRIRQVLRDANDNLIVIGGFNNYAGVSRTSIVRLDANGALDPSFNPNLNGVVTSAALQADGKILIGGTFNRITNRDGVTSYTRTGLARLLASGDVDPDFDPRANSFVNAFIFQGDKIVIGGAFTSLQPGGTGTAISRFYLARLNANGTVDETFQCDAGATVTTLLKQTDDAFVVGGEFTGIVPKGSNNQAFRRYLARVTGDGALDNDFDPRPNGFVQALALQADGQVLVGGEFNAFLPVNATTSTVRRFLARLSADGKTIDAFDPSPDNAVYSVAVMPDNTIVVGGVFSSFTPNGATTATARRGLAWLNADGSLHSTRDYESDRVIWSVLPLGDGRVLVAGEVEALSRAGGSYFLTEDHIARLGTDGSPDATFTPSSGVAATGSVNAIVHEVDGQVLVGGSFADLSGSANSNLTRLSHAGVPDGNFGSRINGPVNALFVRNPTADATNTTGPLTWLTAAGALRPSGEFTTAATSQLSGTVVAVLPLADGRMLLGGTFTNLADTTGDNLVRLNTDGTLDTSFNPAPNSGVTALAIDSAGRILVGGAFTEIFGDARTNFARITAAGALDTVDMRPNGVVRVIVPTTADAFFIGGDFTTIQPHGQTTATSRAYIARITPEGTIDSAFAPTLNGSVFAILPQTADRMLIGGNFSTAGSVAHRGIARLNPTNAELDTAFTLQFNGVVEEFAVQADNKILCGGGFTTLGTSDTATTVNRRFVARFSIDTAGVGTVDDTFQPTINSNVHAISVGPDGRIVIGGDFSTITPAGATETTIRRFVARLTADGAIDDSFNPQPNGPIWDVQVQSDTANANSVILAGAFTSVLPEALILAGGEFTQVGNAVLPYLARLNDDGSADPSYLPNPDGAVHALAALADGRVFVGGAFQNFGTDPLVPRGGMAIIAADGTLDSSFTTAADGPVHAVSVQADGQVVIGGSFANVGGAAHANVARLAADGSVDASFAATTDGAVATVVAQPDGKVIMAGAFTTVNGSAQPYLARLNVNGSLDAAFAPVLDGAVSAVALQSDGGLLIGGAFTTVSGSARSRFARLTATGAVDPTVTFDFDGEVRAISPLVDGRAVVGGSFRVAAGRARHLVTRVPTAAGATQTVSVNAARTQFTWTNGGTRAEFSNVRISTSLDRTTWTDQGLATRTGSPGVWQITFSTALPADTLYYIRAGATLPSSRNYSTGRFETSWQFLNDQIAGPRSIGVGDAGSSGNGGGGGSGGSPDDGSDGSGGSGGTGGDDDDSGGSGGSGGHGDGDGSSGSALPAYHLTNFSVRAQPNNGEKLITGFVIRAAASERVVLRAVGPGLSAYVSGVMAAPLLELYGDDGSLLASSTAWNGDSGLTQAFTDVGAFPLDPTSADAAQAPVLAPGLYTTHVSPADAANGIALAEVYFDGSSEGAGGLANLSARGPVGEGEAVLIVGFVVGGDQPRRFLVRGVGPGLLDYGVADALVDPSVLVFDQDGDPVAANNDWQSQTGTTTASEINAAASSSGAFALAAGSKDSALVLTLAPGVYTAHVMGTAAGTGLVEVYELP